MFYILRLFYIDDGVVASDSEKYLADSSFCMVVSGGFKFLYGCQVGFRNSVACSGKLRFLTCFCSEIIAFSLVCLFDFFVYAL